MSYFECPKPDATPESSSSEIQHVIVPRSRDLGGFEVARVLPSVQRRMVGPFVFLDQMGPARFDAGKGLDVPAHPHIGLATVTYLFSGEIMHRDSLGTRQLIHPGAVNWMTAGRGIAHSERTPDKARRAPGELFGLQAWLALPAEHEETDPDFAHHACEDLPMIEDGGARVRVLAGSLYGRRSPVALLADTIYADIQLEPGARLPLDSRHEERALYIAVGSVLIDGKRFEAGRLLVLAPGAALTVEAVQEAGLMLLGGEPMDGPRHIWWNFVSSSAERIEQAKADWQAGRFDPVIDETEALPLPGGRR